MFKKVRDFSIRTKLIFGSTMIFVLSSLFCGLAIYRHVRTTIEVHLENELTNATAGIKNMVSTAAATSIKNYLRAIAEKNRDVVQSIYGEFLRGRLSEEEAKARCRQILYSQTIGKTGYLFCANSMGIAVEHPNPGVVGKDFANWSFVREMIRLKTGYLEYDWRNPEDHGLKAKAMYITYFEPWDWIIAASSYREEFKELVNISDFRESILNLTFGKTGYAYITDSVGNLIVHPFNSGNYYDEQDVNGRYFVREICERKNGKAVYTWQNTKDHQPRAKMVIFNYIKEYDWIVASTSYLDEIFLPLDTIRNTLMLLVGISCVLMFVASLGINNSVLQPMQLLMQQLAIGAAGDFSGRLPVRANDEIGRLSTYFNRFMDTLQRFGDSLRAEIDKHQQTALALRTSEEKYRTILEKMEEGYFEVNLAGTFTFCNNAMGRIFGTTAEKVVGVDIRGWMEEKSVKVFEQIADMVRQTGHARQPSELEIVRPNGLRSILETSISLRKNQDKQPIGYSGVVRDITQRKNSEKALRLSEEMFSKAFRSNPSAMFIASLADSRMINVNDSFLNITGYGLFDLIGKQLFEIKFFYNEDIGQELRKDLLAYSQVRNREILFFTAQGVKRTGLLSVELVTLWGEKCLLGAIEDITETRRLEREILTISEKERQSIALNLHDDLCPQLIGIEAMVKMLVTRLNHKAGWLQDAIHQETEQAATIRSLIQDSIQKTRQLSKGLSPVNIVARGFDTSLEDLVMSVRKLFALQCQLVYEVKEPFHDNTVATHVYYIIQEAVQNAIKHGHARKIEINVKKQQKRIVLTVIDDGVGMEMTTMPKGIGIEIMQYRARLIGGTLTFQSPSQGGTSVHLTVVEPDFL